MRLHLINPSELSFGTAVITPRWLYVLAAATPAEFGDPLIADETLEPFDLETVSSAAMSSGIGIHTAQCAARVSARPSRHGSRAPPSSSAAFTRRSIPDEAREHGAAHAVVKGDGDAGLAERCCGLRRPARWRPSTTAAASRRLVHSGALGPAADKTATCGDRCRPCAGCPKHCSFCSVWRTDGQKPRQRGVTRSCAKSSTLRRQGFRFILLADDNFYPVTLPISRRRAGAATRASSRSSRDFARSASS